ncbi:hypothetical protein J4441_00475 [Candidatus Micrarchaeota archaeon]|nr:hypothetical protein [Candidatus Micrarchaeota archaeon]
MKDIQIAGCGPSALACATMLAKDRIEAHVHERAPILAPRFTDSFQVLENWTEETPFPQQLKAAGIAADFFCQPVHKFLAYDEKMRCFECKSKQPYWFLIRRGREQDSLDSALLQSAQHYGAKVHFSSTLAYENAGIIAGGPSGADGVAMETSFDADLAEKTCAVLLGNKIAPRAGYAYLLSDGKRATLGTAITDDFSNLVSYHTKAMGLFAQEFSLHIPENPQTKANYVNFFLPKTAQQNNRLYIGEAAGFQDLSLGIGLRYSIQSGMLAAQSILQGQNFDLMWKKEFSQKFKIAAGLRIALESSGNSGISHFLSGASKSDLREYLSSLYRPSMLKNSLASIAMRVRRNKNCNHGERCEWCLKR